MKHHTSSAVARTTPYEIEGRAFLPGEIIGVAILLRNTEANRYGEALPNSPAAVRASCCSGTTPERFTTKTPADAVMPGREAAAHLTA